MAAVKILSVAVVAVLCVFLQPRIRAQPTIDSSSEDDSCSGLNEKEGGFQVDNVRLRSELESERQRMKTLESLSRAQSEEIRQLKLEKERSQLRAREVQREAVKFIGSYGSPAQSHAGITKVENSIYVLRQTGIDVYADSNDFRFIKRIDINKLINPYDIIYSKTSKHVYISMMGPPRCIWVMTTTGGNQLTQWLTNITWPYTLSLSKEGHMLVLRNDRLYSQLDTYSLNTTLIRRLNLPQDIKDPRHVVQTPDGSFIICHRLNNATEGQWIISQLTNDGQLIHRFLPRNQSEMFSHPEYMSLDSDNNRLFVADRYNHRVISLDSSVLTWRRVLVSGGFGSPCRMFYDASKKYLVVAANFLNFFVYEIN